MRSRVRHRASSSICREATPFQRPWSVTLSQSLRHFFRHAKGRLQTGQVLTGKSDFFRMVGMGHSPRRASAVCMRLRRQAG